MMCYGPVSYAWQIAHTSCRNTHDMSEGAKIWVGPRPQGFDKVNSSTSCNTYF